MQTYLVGGAVRDLLLGLPVSDRDWTVVGASPQQMLDAGFRMVGRDFPVFIHPESGEEYALARTERKIAPGYAGFAFHAAPDVTLEQDLARRDLTINAMAQDAQGRLIDPHGGQDDLAARVLRHVSPAFAEDPVRILRLARFAARFADFTVADETMALVRSMVAAGEVDALVPERVWQELSRGLMEARPSRLFDVLREGGALPRLLPEVDRLWGVPQRADVHPEIDCGRHLMMVMDMSARLGASLPVRFACLGHDLRKGTTAAEDLPGQAGHEGRSVALLHTLCDRLRVPNDCRELAEVVAREHGQVHASDRLDATGLAALLQRCDALRRPERFADVLLTCECDSRGRLGFADTTYPQRARLLCALAAARGVDTGQIAAQARRQGRHGPDIGADIERARAEAIDAALAGAGPGSG